jgi:nuclear receptor co-repressor 1
MYNPQVEAISPTLPSEDKDEKSSKDELLASIGTMDREIAKLETQISKLQRTQQKLEYEAKKPPEEKSSTPEPILDFRHHSIAQIIYAENRVYG